MQYNTKITPSNASGRFLSCGDTEAPYTILGGCEGGKLAWASTVCEPENEPRSTIRLLAVLLLRNRELLATRHRVFGFPALATQAIEEEILARRRAVLGVRSWSRDRSTRRLVQGDSRASTVAVGA